ncbi:MAG: lipoate--protein ligase family protein [Actinomycetales bacterium]|nr:lipoate--protein ligase family protein [Actinomycetales bacterium]
MGGEDATLGFRTLLASARARASDDVAHVTEVLRAARELPDGARFLDLRVPPPLLAFSRRDTHRPGFEAAAAHARPRGFAPVVRHVGGSFAPLHGGSLVLEHYGTSPDAARSSVARFVEHSGVLRDALGALGLDARVGELPGEYCPGEHSVNVAGRAKVAGVAQRVSGHAWVVSTVVQVHGAALLRDVTVECARLLGEEIDPETIGDLAGEGVALDVAAVGQHLAAAFCAAGLVAPPDVHLPGQLR